MRYCPRCGKRVIGGNIRYNLVFNCDVCDYSCTPADLLDDVDKAHDVWVMYLYNCANGLIEKPKEKGYV